MHDDSIELTRGDKRIGQYNLLDCSWFIATPRHDSGIAKAWSLVFPNPKVVIIEFPERGGWYHQATQLAAVGWTEESFADWERTMRNAGVTEGRGQSREACS